MSTGARIFFVGSLILTVGTVFAVNYYNNDEKQVFSWIFIIKIFLKMNSLEKTS